MREALGLSDASDDARPLHRALLALKQSLSLNDQAGARLSEVMATLAGFVKLDAVELSRVELAHCCGTRSQYSLRPSVPTQWW